MQDEEDDRQNREDDQANGRPLLHFALHRLALVLAEEGLAGAAERVDPRRIARLEEHDDDGDERTHSHQCQQYKADYLINRPHFRTGQRGQQGANDRRHV